MRFGYLIVAAALAQGYCGAAAAYCSQPSRPYCASRYGEFADDSELLRCRRDMESYKSDVDDFVECNNRAAQTALSEARSKNEHAQSEYRSAVESFNRRARQ